MEKYKYAHVEFTFLGNETKINVTSDKECRGELSKNVFLVNRINKGPVIISLEATKELYAFCEKSSYDVLRRSKGNKVTFGWFITEKEKCHTDS